MKINKSPQVLVLGYSDELGDPLLLAVLIDVQIGKDNVAARPGELEPETVDLEWFSAGELCDTSRGRG
jgi:hypothetical protein